MRHVMILAASSFVVFSAACGAPSAPQEAEPTARALGDEAPAETQEALSTTYLDMQEFVSGADQDRYFAMTAALKQGFDDVCGDTFCEGDYANLEALGFRCAVTSKTGKIKSCVWTFAGSYEQVDEKTGAINVNAKTFTCPLPVKGTAKNLLDALTAPGTVPAIRRPLPGTTQSAYDALGGCI